MKDERNRILEKAIEIYGEEAQIGITIEELSELITELARKQRGRDRLPEIQEEIADAQLCLDQMKRLHNTTKIQEWEDKKLERLEKRLEKDTLLNSKEEKK